MESFNDKVFWANIGTTHSTGYALCQLEKLPPRYRKLVEKQFGMKFPKHEPMVNKEFDESKKDIEIRKQANRINDLEKKVISKDIEIKILEDELLLYRSNPANNITPVKNKKRKR